MSIYIGTPDNISALVNTPYGGINGSVAPQKVYIGDENNLSREVWGTTIYQYVNFIVPYSDGAVIDTGIVPTNTTKIFAEITIQPGANTNNYIGGSRYGGTPTSYFTLLLNSTKVRYQFGSATLYDVGTLQLERKYQIYMNDNHTAYIVDGSSRTITDTLSGASLSLWLFGVHSGGSTSSLFGNAPRMHQCKIWEGDTLVRDFHPCYRIVDQVIGMYDRVSRQFFTNAGSSYFIKGPNI